MSASRFRGAASDPHSRRWTLVGVLTWGLGVLMFVAVGSVLVIGVVGGVRGAAELTADKASLIVASVSGQVREHVEAAAAQAAFVANRIEARDLEPSDHLQMRSALIASMAAAPQLASVAYVGTEFLTAIHIDRIEGEIHANTQDWSLDERAVAGMREVKRAEDGFWGEPLYIERFGDALVNYRMPVRRDGEAIGALLATVGTRDLSRYAASVASPHDAVAFVLFGPDEVLAHPALARGWPGRTIDAPLLSLADIGDPVLAGIWDESRSRASRVHRPGFEARIHSIGDQHWVVVVERLYGIGPIPWIVGCYFPAANLAQGFERMKLAAVVGLVLLMLAVAAVFAIGRRASRPVLALADAAQLVRTQGPEGVAPLARSRLRELDVAAVAFNEMVEGLRDRERMRETFGKYVPESMLEGILADDGILAPQTRLTTTLFTDIVGFSTVSERMTPQQLIDTLNEYFAVAVDAIERHGGVIHQFQGDAILATYNLPVESAEHAAQAIRTAIEIASSTATRQFGDGVLLATRVGVNTGLAVCGTVGAEGRLGFTVHGDEVNLAARIEQMNKTLGTRVLIAESTMKLAGGEFEFERMGELPVRGRSRSVVVYRVAGPHRAAEVDPVPDL